MKKTLYLDFLVEHGLRERLILVKSWKPETVKNCIERLRAITDETNA